MRASDPNASAGGTVELTATKISGINDGVFASFSTKVVAADGKLAAKVLPGEYRVRVVPDVSSSLAALETVLSVPVTGGPSPDVLLVPAAASIRGTATAPGGAPLDGASVQALPASVGVRNCGDGADAAACQAAPLGVIDLALAQDAFLPRPATGLVSGGQFTLEEVDCGGCTPGNGASFDLSLRPQDGSGLPWGVRPGVRVASAVDVGALRLPLPIVERGVVEIPTEKDPVLVGNALIRAYVLRDDRGEPVLDPEGLPNCATSGGTTSLAKQPHCVRSALQVAETRGAQDGTFELVLPSDLETSP